MLGVVPISVYLTLRQLVTQKGVRLSLNSSREEMDGTVVELLTGSTTSAPPTPHGWNWTALPAAGRGPPANKEIRHHFEMSLYGCAKALNEGFFHILVLAFAIYFAIHGRSASATS